MRHVRSISNPDARRGVILMVVLALLTLFAVLGLSFVLYANAQSKSSDLALAAEASVAEATLPDAPLINHFMAQLLTDTDNQTGVFSAMRGHSLGRSAYGYNETSLNVLPFNGVGRVHGQTNPFGVDDYLLVNYTYFPNDNFIRDPERVGFRPSPNSPYANSAFVGSNVPYTYPDLNNMWLAAVKADGTVLLPSFHRGWTGFGPTGSLDPSNPGWYAPSTAPTLPVPPTVTVLPADPTLKYRVMRPRPADQLLPNEVWDMNQRAPYNLSTKTYRTRFFPPPVNAGGDVQNLVSSPGTLVNPGPPAPTYANNDSFWMDLGFPVLVDASGRKYKPLFAPLIVDLDNRINLNVIGNIRGQGATHASNQGWGPWTVNIGQVLNSPAAPNEWNQLFLGLSGQAPVPGRYGSPGTTGSSAVFGMPAPHLYAPVDYDGSNDDGTPTNPINPFGAAPYGSFPSFAAGFGNGSVNELKNHPASFNVFQSTSSDHLFGISNMDALLRYGDLGTSSIPSDLMRLAPNNFTNPIPSNPALQQAVQRIRRMVTTHSIDVDKPGITPWLWQQTTPTPAYQLNGSYPSGGPIGFPTPPNAISGPKPSDFITQDWRAITATLGRLDLNRPLPNYPDPISGQITDVAGFQVAQSARIQMAQDIFTVLLATTMGLSPTPPSLGSVANPSPTYDAARWLAQLAVNIVDFIDNDEYMTPFNWNGSDWVFGTELPRVVINEAFAMYNYGGGANPTGPTKVSVWVELYNAFNNDPTLITPPGPGANPGDVPLSTTLNPAVYQIVLANSGTTASQYYRRADNIWGTSFPIQLPGDTDQTIPVTPGPVGPRPPGDQLTPANAGVSSWGAAPQFLRASNGANNGATGYYLVGPGAIPGGGPTPDNQQTSMQYTSALNAPHSAPTAPTVLLQRLACPYMPFNNSPGSLQYNPYITVDYMQNVNADSLPPSTPTNPTIVTKNDETTIAAGNYNVMQSDGRIQAYYGYSAFGSNAGKSPTSMATPPKNQPQQTFTSQAAALPGLNTQLPGYPGGPGNFSWPVHLDRQLSSPMELLQVSAWKPHEFTQEFINPALTALKPFNHRAPWFDEDSPTAPTPAYPLGTPGSHLLYRFLEFVTTRGRSVGLQAPTVALQAPAVNFTGIPGQPQALQAFPQNMSGLTTGGTPVSIQPGSVVIMEIGTPNQENVRVVSVTPFSFAAQFCKSHAAGSSITLTTTGDRIPGKINLNTIWDQEVFNALCDPQVSNNFTSTDVSNIFNALIASRNPAPGNLPSASDQPFWGLATGLYPTVDPQFPNYGINNTLLRGAANIGTYTPRLFEVTSNTNATNLPPSTMPPYTKYQLLNKVFNNVTTRSNVFAVWMTVGFFEVIDDTSSPPKLGAEIGASTNQKIRHRYFAIVDRSNLVVQANQITAGSGLTTGIPVTVGTTQIAIAAGPNKTVPFNGQLSGTTSQSSPSPAHSWPWSIQAGTALVVEPGTPNQEVIIVAGLASSPPTIVAMFTKPHPLGVQMILYLYPGFGGPQPNFDVQANSAIVPYYNIIN